MNQVSVERNRGHQASERDNLRVFVVRPFFLFSSFFPSSTENCVSFFFRFERRRGRFDSSLLLSLLLSFSAMAANLASDPRRPPSLAPVSLQTATAPNGDDSSVASTLLAATDALAVAARSLLPRLKPDPDNRRPPLSLTDAQSISQSRADERRRVQARKEKAGKASAKAFAISGGVGVGVTVGKGGGAPSAAAGSQQQHSLLPHHTQGVGSEFPGAVPEGESDKSAYWTFVQVRLIDVFLLLRSIKASTTSRTSSLLSPFSRNTKKQTRSNSGLLPRAHRRRPRRRPPDGRNQWQRGRERNGS